MELSVAVVLIILGLANTGAELDACRINPQS
jgi:hypothetical protein